LSEQRYDDKDSILSALERLDGHFRRYLARRPTFNLDEALAESESVLRANGRWIESYDRKDAVRGD
jgi:hypothetical protein